MYWLHRLLGLVTLLVICGLIGQLEQRFSLGVAATIYAGVVILATLVGALLLQSSAVGQSSWRNVLASKFLPCSGIFGYGSLLKLCLSNLLGTMLLGLRRSHPIKDWVNRNVEIPSCGCLCGVAWIVFWMRSKTESNDDRPIVISCDSDPRNS